MLNYSENLKKIRTLLDIKPSDFADLLSIQYRTYLSYERGERSIPLEIIEQIVNKYNVNANYIFTGQGEMFLPAQKTQEQTETEKALKEKKTFGQRLNYLQAQKNLTDALLAKETSIKESRLEKLGLDKEEPTLEELKKFKKYFGVSIDLLLDGEGEINAPALSAEEQKILDVFKKAKENNLL